MNSFYNLTRCICLLSIALLCVATPAQAQQEEDALLQQVVALKERAEKGDLTAMQDYMGLMNQVAQLQRTDPARFQKIMEAMGAGADRETPEEREQRHQRAAETDARDEELRRMMTNPPASSGSPIEDARQKEAMMDEVIREMMSDPAYADAPGAGDIQGLQDIQELYGATGPRLDDPGFVAWKDEYVASLTAEQAVRERDLLRVRYKRHALLVGAPRIEAEEQDESTGISVEPVTDAELMSRGEALAASIEMAMKNGYADRVIENTNRLRSGQAPLPMDSPASIYAPTGSKDRPARQSELRRSAKELEKLARGGSASQRVHSLNALGMAQCLLGKAEAADQSFVSAASSADGASLSSHDQYALHLNSQIHGCSGSVAFREDRLEKRDVAGMGAFKDMMRGHLTSGYEAFREARSTVGANDSLVVGSGLFFMTIASQMGGNYAGLARQLAELHKDSLGTNDPLLSGAVRLTQAAVSVQLGDTESAKGFLVKAEQQALPVLSADAGATRSTPAAQASAPDLQSRDLLRIAEEMGYEPSDDLLAIVDPAGSMLANEPQDPSAAVGYYLEAMWVNQVSRINQLDGGVTGSELFGEDFATLNEATTKSKRALAAGLVGYPTEMSRTIEESSAIMDLVANKNLYELSFAEQLFFLTSYLPTQASVILSTTRHAPIDDGTFERLVNWKGLLTLATRKQAEVISAAVADSAYRGDAERLRDLRERISAALVSGAASDESLAELTAEKEQLERRLNAQFGSPLQANERVTLEELRSLLSRNAVFVDIYMYDRYEYAEFESTNYAAIVIRDGKQLEVIELGKKSDIDAAIAAWRQSAVSGSTNERQHWESLRDRVWTNLVSGAGLGNEKIYLAPDGELARIPWHLFPASGELTQVDSARAFKQVRAERSGAAGRGVLLVGDVDFGNGPLSLQPLAGTAREVEEIAVMATREGLTSNSLTAADATEGNVVSGLENNGWIHFATHGLFFSSEQARASSRGFVAMVDQSASTEPQSAPPSRNPMMSSGLAFAGINDISPSNTSGYLSAEELLGINFSGAELVVLSACNTGRGVEATGQGVIGLRSALTSAGARRVLMSLWEVDDEATTELMQEFYSAIWNEGLKPAQALDRAQERVRSNPRFAHPYYWAAWILVDGT